MKYTGKELKKLLEAGDSTLYGKSAELAQLEVVRQNYDMLREAAFRGMDALVFRDTPYHPYYFTSVVRDLDLLSEQQCDSFRAQMFARFPQDCSVACEYFSQLYNQSRNSEALLVLKRHLQLSPTEFEYSGPSYARFLCANGEREFARSLWQRRCPEGADISCVVSWFAAGNTGYNPLYGYSYYTFDAIYPGIVAQNRDRLAAAARAGFAKIVSSKGDFYPFCWKMLYDQKILTLDEFKVLVRLVTIEQPAGKAAEWLAEQK